MAGRENGERISRTNDNDNDEEHWGPRLKPFVSKLPLEPAPEVREEEEYTLEPKIWLPKEKERAPEFLELFYDLVFVAVLSVFSTTHEVSSAQSVVVYFSYFVIIWWTWVSQILYDVHFQMDDWLHRIFKCAQLGIFAFLGAEAANFTPYQVEQSAEQTTAGIQQSDAAASYSGVATVYAVGRCLLVLQYLIVAMRLRFRIKLHMPHPHLHHSHTMTGAEARQPIHPHLLHSHTATGVDAHPYHSPSIKDRDHANSYNAVSHVGEPPHTKEFFGWFFEGYFRWIAFPAGVYAVSASLWFVGAFINASAAVKLALPYAALTLEIVTTMTGLPFKSVNSIEPPARLISERSTALTLIILGEGIIGLIRSFSFTISGFGFTPQAYAQCICALIIVFACWHFLFHNLGPGSKSGVKKPIHRRFWLILHLPLHFCILLLFAGIRNATTYGNINTAIGAVQEKLTDITTALKLGDLGLAQPQNDWLTTELGKLDMQTPWLTELNKLNLSITEPTYPHDAKIEVLSYSAEICVAITTSFQIELSDDVMALYDTVANLNDSWVKSSNLQQFKVETNDTAIYNQFFQAYSTELAQGVLFLFPSAGGVLVLASILLLIRNRPRGHVLKKDHWVWTYWFLQLFVGVGLCLLGFLDNGDKDMNLTGPVIVVYRLLSANWMLPIVALVYAGLIALECATLVIAFKEKSKSKDAGLPTTDGLPALDRSPQSFMSSSSDKRGEKRDGDMV